MQVRQLPRERKEEGKKLRRQLSRAGGRAQLVCSTAEPQDKTDSQGHGSPPWVVAPTLRAEPVPTEAEKCLLPLGCLLPKGTKKALSQPKSSMREIPPNPLEE